MECKKGLFGKTDKVFCNFPKVTLGVESYKKKNAFYKKRNFVTLCNFLKLRDNP
nr:MAG TPA: hypothetical protein [Caudoviricetes sp.]